MASRWKSISTACGPTLRIYEIPGIRSIACGVLVRAGTRDEQWPREAGLAHALEHMLFQGTRDFPSSAALNAEIENLGGFINAWTGPEETFFFTRLPACDFEKGIYILSQQLLHSRFAEEKVRIEMQNIVQEICRKDDDPQNYLLTRARKNLYGNHLLAREILGAKESVSSFGRQDFLDFQARYYNARNFDFIVVGQMPEGGEAELVAGFSHYFRDLGSKDFNRRDLSFFSQSRLKFLQESRKVQQVSIVLSALTCSGISWEASSLNLFRNMISGGASFPLFIEVRDKLGLCYEIWADHRNMTDLGCFMIYVGTSPERYNEALRAIRQVIEKSKNDAALMERTKKRIRGATALMYESPMNILTLAVQDIMIFGRPRNFEERVERIEAITINDIERAVDKYLSKEAMVLAMLTPSDFEVPTPN